MMTPNPNRQLVNLPSYSPDFDADEAIQRRARCETSNEKHKASYRELNAATADGKTERQ